MDDTHARKYHEAYPVNAASPFAHGESSDRFDSAMPGGSRQEVFLEADVRRLRHTVTVSIRH